jgi:hypothetical protein
MGLSSHDELPQGITMSDGYTKIREWYKKNVDTISSREGDYAQRSARLIRALPSADAVSELEIRAIFQEVISGLLEWAYHEYDGHFKMASYASGAIESAGLPRWLSKAEQEELRESRLWPYLSFSQKR